MILRAVVALTVLGAGSAQAQEIAVPSGVPMSLFEVLFEDDPVALARFRFVVPAIAEGAVPFAEVLPDIEYLCGDVAIPALAANGWTEGQVVISLSEAELELGDIAPEITQYFQPFSVKDGACIWEDF